MKMQLTTLCIPVVLFAMACSPVEAPRSGEDHHDHAEHAGANAEAGSGPVQLDNGKKWEANPETTQGIEAMAAIVDGYDANTSDAAVLKEELDAEFKEIFAKCTMTGEAHDQLHNYLLPLKKKLEALGAEPTNDELADLRQYLGTFSSYFH